MYHLSLYYAIPDIKTHKYNSGLYSCKIVPIYVIGE
jgi:hypothetical protein